MIVQMYHGNGLYAQYKYNKLSNKYVWQMHVQVQGFLDP
jgi:hypothetical protein